MAVAAVNSILGTLKLGRSGCLGKTGDVCHFWNCAGFAWVLVLFYHRRTSRGLGANTDVRPHTNCTAYQFNNFGLVFHVQCGDDDKAHITGLVFTERTPVNASFILLCLSAFSLKSGPRGDPCSCHPLFRHRKREGRKAGRWNKMPGAVWSMDGLNLSRRGAWGKIISWCIL